MDEQTCPSVRLLKFFGKKWTLMILRVLQEQETVRFNGFIAELEGISPKTLSERLDRFQEFGIVEKERFNEVPPRTEYRLTDKGEELLECLRCMDRWADRHGLPD
ncbi:MAG: helix-turn-helix domain-containing protein [Candidatus Nanohaloarchaea archaeon]|nr:helix-turn-helix domain-containing protein [Candidatus Nanohaloarchaea archaeon]